MSENKIPLIPFGHTPDSKELLSWNLMETSDPPYNYAKLIATRGLAVVPFVRISESQNANKLKTCFYSESYLKKWLNTTFLQEYFSEDERKYIRSVDIPSSKDIEKWFPEEHDRICIPTQFAIDNNAVIFENNNSLKTCVYWLSDTGRKVGMSATVILSNGKIYKSAYMAATNVCVRPVIEVARKEQW